MSTDPFGNHIDPTVGYARGTLLGSSADEIRRLRHARRIAADISARNGADAIAIFTGNSRNFPLRPADLARCCEEWVGSGVIADSLREVAVEHLGGGADHIAAVVNRTSGGIISAILALCGDRPVVSVVPCGDRSHASLVRGCALAGVGFVEVDAPVAVVGAVDRHAPDLVFVTTVTSSLARMEDIDTAAAITVAKSAGATVFMDEAYGARLRPVLHGGAKPLSFGADLAITNTDKAGLGGPRAGVLAGLADPVVATVAKASELGIEARAPIAAGALRSLQAFDPRVLEQEAAGGRAVADAVVAQFGAEAVTRTDLGPAIDENEVMATILDRSAGGCDLVPCEVTAAVGMLLLRDHGVLTVNTHGQPGGRVSLRLKPTAGAIDRVGGAQALATAVNEAISEVARNASDLDWIARLLFGDTPGSRDGR